jgi:hypothetical protein
MTAERTEVSGDSDRVGISLYEFYALGIERLLVKAPWELERAVSKYHESFLAEQRCIGLSILLLLGEDHVPKDAVESMPGFEDQIRVSVNQAVFLRALRRYFEQNGIKSTRADAVLEHMQSYLAASRSASVAKEDPLEAMLETMIKRVPPQTDDQRAQYAARVGKIYDYIESLVERSLLKRYEVSS